MASERAVAEVLDAAVALMDGGHWCQGQTRRETNGVVMSYCAVGAIQQAVANTGIIDFYIRKDLETDALLTLARTHSKSPPIDREEAIAKITAWNDHASLAWDAVRSRFKVAHKHVLKRKVVRKEE